MSSTGRPLMPPVALARSTAICTPTSAVVPPAAAVPDSGCSVPTLYGRAWPNASRHGAGTSIAVPRALAAVDESARNFRRVVLPLHHMDLAQDSSCQRPVMPASFGEPTGWAGGSRKRSLLSTLTGRTVQGLRAQSVPGYVPPSIRKFPPVMKPAWALQTNAQSSPNSAGSPKRPAGVARCRSRTTSSTVRPLVFAWMAMVERSRSVSKGPGRRLLIVTLWPTVLRASPATKPVSPVRAPFESPRMSMGCFTALDVILTMRPKRRAIMPSTVALIRRIGVIMFASSALIQVSRSHSRKSPGGGPPALLTRMSGAGHAASSAARPASVVTSPATAVTRTPVASRISFAAASSTSFVRAIIVMFTPSRASDMAHAFPSPRLEAQTIAFRPLIPRSIGPSSTSRPCLHQLRGDWEARGKDRAATRLALRGADGGEWRAAARRGGAAEAHECVLHAVVHVDVRRGVENPHQGVETVVDPPCAVHVPLLGRLEEFGLQVGDGAPHSRDGAVGAEPECTH